MYNNSVQDKQKSEACLATKYRVPNLVQGYTAGGAPQTTVQGGGVTQYLATPLPPMRLLVRLQRLQLFVRNCERCKMHICDAMHAS
jgi:hypothetical protein